jgi:beta-barrel assembly-enhancing protease
VKIKASSLILVLPFAAALTAVPLVAWAVSPPKRSRSDKNIDAIGHRKITHDANFYSLAKETELGKNLSVEVERSARLLRDPAIAAYVERLAQKIAQNSDADLPITVQVTDSNEVDAFTLPGGYQYVSRGLLLRLESEGELASVLARGVAHTALHSAAREATRNELMKAASIPLIMSGQDVKGSSSSTLAVPLTLIKWKQENELDADYFGLQYLYKAGYDPECFVRFVQRIWPTSPTSVSAIAKAFSTFPPPPERLEALRREVADLLPRRDGSIVSTPEFQEFRERLRTWKPEEPAPKLTPIALVP